MDSYPDARALAARTMYRVMNGKLGRYARGMNCSESTASRHRRAVCGPPKRFFDWLERAAADPQLEALHIVFEADVVVKRQEVKRRPLPELVARWREARLEIIRAQADIARAEAAGDAAALREAEARRGKLAIERAALLDVMMNAHKHNPLG